MAVPLKRIRARNVVRSNESPRETMSSGHGGKREGAGRKKSGNTLTTMFSVRCTEEEKEQLQRFMERLRRAR